jgi:hypothetical protein
MAAGVFFCRHFAFAEKKRTGPPLPYRFGAAALPRFALPVSARLRHA